MKLPEKFPVGIYDESLRITKELVEILGQEEVLTLGLNATHQGYLRAETIAFQQGGQRGLREGTGLGPVGDFSFSKDFFLRRCRHIIVAISGTPSLSMALSALRYLINDIPQTLTVIGVENLDPLISLGEPDERERSTELLTEGRLLIRQDFLPSEWLTTHKLF